MESKKKRSVGLLIRRFLAGYIFISVVVQLIGEISEGEFSGQSLDDLAFGLLGLPKTQGNRRWLQQIHIC